MVNKTNNLLSPSLTENEIRSRHTTLEIQVLTWYRHKHAAGLKRMMSCHYFEHVFICRVEATLTCYF